ncbi:hypothetical protein [Prevotella amnii]|uniref:hypothetical protein n=1 Tax=Prevotella amnii TaxID=419005 RepID=UPI000364A209|nr:hypothetical protein [Prevotella amnii]
MQKKRFQNRIAESRWTTTFVLPVFSLVWVIAIYNNTEVLLPALCMLFSTFLMMSLNNNNGLIRIYSRMVSCSFLILATLDAVHFSLLPQGIVTLGEVGFFTLAFKSYQKSISPGYIFYAFLCIGIISVVWVQVIYFLPLLWIVMRFSLLSMSKHNFVASVFGILCPYWFLLLYLGITDNLEWFIFHFGKLLEFGRPLDFDVIPFHQAISLIFISICCVIGTIHYLRQRRNDIIRTRLFCQAFVSCNFGAFVFLLLQPQQAIYIQSLLIVSTAPLIGHFFALTKTRFTNWLFCILCLSCIFVTLYNLWNF